MNVVDSCGWLEYLASGPNADFFSPALTDVESLIVPAVSIYEVFKRVLQQRDEGDAFQVVALMQQGRIVDFDATLAIEAATLSVDLGLPMADAIMLSTARAHGATLWTQDSHFEGVEGVRYKDVRPG
ncbi:MAG TPA: VapC toxin family PIN domain ribonuclease [Coriobacteriia bacterium]|jgi:predicted nucleic acid-binding protein|uniref:type II toxin-antitoxin system VapC family toxin n=1 Tax=Anaerosoma tenue TaxID=2933588 RepID=UPI00076C119C|nr:type II toxin-antitoxin system VapC family toxin [Anaerosoma tenue]KUK48344.1 MAG: putative ribonuclease VapC [Actinobacteria bacterium 66_15]MCK8114543.1 type II toxin-antitoxin system VapC family toxin [Anaerosoma tenue]HAL31290.1 VapC toxin family PIN domain ribonuclease [Coriobacteriia bacterium]